MNLAEAVAIGDFMLSSHNRNQIYVVNDAMTTTYRHRVTNAFHLQALATIRLWLEQLSIV